MASDINLKSFLLTQAPVLARPYIKLARLDRPVGIWLLLLPTWWAIILAQPHIMDMGKPGFLLLFKTLIGAVLMRSAGCVVNDIWDHKLDAQVARTRTRPLSTGEVSLQNAFKFVGGLVGVSFLILLTLPKMAIFLGFLSLPLVATYPMMKRITWWPQLFLGFTFNWGALLGWAAATGSLSGASIFLYIAGIFWTLGYDTIYAHQDKEDDATVGIRSTARLLGEWSETFVTGAYGLFFLFLLFAKSAGGFGMLTPLFSVATLAQMIWQMTVWKKDDPVSCLRVFKSNVLLGAIVLLLMAT